MEKMVRVKVCELSGVALNYAVAIACDYKCALESPVSGPDEWVVMGREEMWLERDPDYFEVWTPSTDWSQGGPLIEKYCVGFGLYSDYFFAVTGLDDLPGDSDGSTHLIAACRAIVAAKLGDEVDVPEGLV